MADQAPPDISRPEWIALGAKVLRQEGPSALTLARLTEREGRTPAAFKAHFKGVGALVLAVAQHWADSEGAAVAQAARAGETPLERLWSLLGLTGASDPPLERGVRALVADYPELGDVVRAADDRRELILTTLLAGAYHLQGNEAHHYARLLQGLHIASLGRKPEEVPAFVAGPVRALTALLESNFPID